MENPNEIWQTEVNGEVYEANFEELTQWITEGSLLPQDKVRRGNLRWIEAQKVPLLHGFFNARELGIAPPPAIITMVRQAPAANLPAQSFTVNSPEQFAAQQQTFNEPSPPQLYQELSSRASTRFCVIHAAAGADYLCETCTSYFCRQCPVQNGCPMCGAICRPLETPRPILPAAAPAPVSPSVPVDEIDDDVRKGANWFYWKAGLTVVNALLMFFGFRWTFFLGLTITQIFQGVADQIALETEITSDAPVTSTANPVNVLVLLISLFCSAFMVMLGYYGGRGKKWALIVGLIIYAIDGVIYLLTASIFGFIIHAIGIYCLVRAISATRK
jgi:hypothetical protein